MQDKMTTQQAYLAMYDFLDGVYDRTQWDALGSLLSSMSLTGDGKPADAALWTDWERSVEKSKAGEVDAGLELS